MSGRILSLHVHPTSAGAAMVPVDVLHCVEGNGIAEDRRYFGRKSRNGGVFKRQVTLIEREQILAHADSLGSVEFAPGDVRSNIETEGVQLVPLIGRHVRVGSAVLLLVEARTPCAKMDALCRGLRSLMENGRQGVIAQVIQTGEIRPGDVVEALPADWQATKAPAS